MHINKDKLELILGRKEFAELLDIKNNHFFKNKKILITGANGSIGTHFQKALTEMGVDFLATDIEGNMEYLDITNFRDCVSVISKYNPDFIVNIAGLKYATRSEHQSGRTVEVNIDGVRNLISACPYGTKVILTSTCKSCNPEIVYGSTKLIAERMIIDNGGSVARFFNVAQSQGNVFEIWNETSSTEPIEVVDECNRHFISVEESCCLILYSMIHRGRFIVSSPGLRNMGDIAKKLYPDRQIRTIKRRRGDRKNELLMSTCEKGIFELNKRVIRILNDHDRIYDFIE
jgi:FlaA1/EpsC-like NDP-sugar epimerase